MSERDDVLEQNLRLLFTRAHRPVRPSAEFRDRLARALERKSSAERTRRFPSLPVRVLAAAGVMLVAALGYGAYRMLDSSAATFESIVKRGSVAIKETAAAEWTEIDPAAARRGLDYSSCSLRVATPRALPLEVRFGSEGRVTVGESSRAELDMLWVRHGVFLASGEVRIDNAAGRQPWTLQGAGMHVDLERGVLHARRAWCAGAKPEELCLVVTLESGRAHFFANGKHDLEIGVECVLFGDRILSATADVEPTTASARTSAARGTATETEPDTAAVHPDEVAGITGTIAHAETDSALGRYLVTLLRRERLPDVSEPLAYPFDGAERFTIRPVKPGTYDIFVEFEGRASWSTRGVEIEAEKTREISIVTVPGTTLSGRVVADATGLPVENALVIIEDQIPAQVIAFDADENTWSASARTDSSGAFRLEHVAAGAHVLRATASGLGASWTARAEFSANDSIELRLGQPGTLAGRVAHEDGRAWRGAIVIASFMRMEGGIERFSYGMGVADEDGQYSITDLPAGNYVLLNVLDTSPGQSSVASRQVHVNAGATTTANLPDTIDGPRFHGRVLDADGVPLGGLDVTLQPRGVDDDSSWRSVRADAEGRFSFAGLPSAGYEVFVGESLGERFVWAETITVSKAGDFEHDIRLGAGSIRGQATSNEGLIAGAFVMLQRAEPGGFVFAGRVRTDARGVFTFERLQLGTYQAIVFPGQKGLAPRASAELWIALNGPPVACEIAIERGASLTVVARDASGTPLPGVALDFVDGAGHAHSFRANDVTGPDGRYEIDGLAAGRWTVSARAHNGAIVTQNIELNVGDERELVLTLP